MDNAPLFPRKGATGRVLPGRIVLVRPDLCMAYGTEVQPKGVTEWREGKVLKVIIDRKLYAFD